MDLGARGSEVSAEQDRLDRCQKTVRNDINLRVPKTGTGVFLGEDTEESPWVIGLRPFPFLTPEP